MLLRNAAPDSILLIEDSPFCADLIISMLNCSNVTVAGSMQIGLRKLRAEAFSVMLLDLGLPDSGGLKTLVTARRHAPEMPIVLVTALDDATKSMDAIYLGAQEVLVKEDMTPRLLKSKIASAKERCRIANLRSKETALKEMCDEYIAGVAHDLKNPLLGSNRILQLLEEQKLGTLNNTQLEMMELIRTSNASLLRMVGDLLQAYRHGRAPNPVDATAHLEKLVREYLSRVQILIDDRSIALRTDIEEVDPVSIDPTSMTRVVDNIVGNAIKYVPDGGQISVKLWQDDQTEVVLQVSDTGPGFSAEERSQLFSRFWRSNRARAGGSGLGLHFCQQLLRAHNGDIYCNEAEQRDGTTFTVKVPLVV